MATNKEITIAIMKYEKAIEKLDSDIEEATKELEKTKQTYIEKLNKLKEALIERLKKTEEKEVVVGTDKYSLLATSGSITILDILKLPKAYMKKVTPSADLKKIKASIAKGTLDPEKDTWFTIESSITLRHTKVKKSKD